MAQHLTPWPDVSQQCPQRCDVCSLEHSLESCIDAMDSDLSLGLLVVSDSDALECISGKLKAYDMHEARTWWAVLEKLKEKTTTFIVLDRSVSDEIIEIVQQISRAAQSLVVVDKLTREVQAAIPAGKLLLVASSREHSALARRFPVLRQVRPLFV